MPLALALAAALLTAQPAATPPAPPAWTVAEFLARYQASALAGAASADPADIQAMREQVVTAGRALRARQTADREAGRPTVYCMPTEAQVQGSELVTYLLTIPDAQRTLPFAEAFARFAINKYPCPAR